MEKEEMNPINGDLGRVYDAVVSIKEDIAKIQTRQEERHSSNKDDIKAIFTKIEKISDNLSERPCAVHNTKLSHMGTHINRLYLMFGSVMVGGMVLGVWMKIFLH